MDKWAMNVDRDLPRGTPVRIRQRLTRWPDSASEDIAEIVSMLLRPPGGSTEAEKGAPAHPLSERFARPLQTAMWIPTPIVEAIQSTWYEDFRLAAETLGHTLMLADVLAPNMALFAALSVRRPSPAAEQTLPVPRQ